jgi:hypothetical protein
MNISANTLFHQNETRDIEVWIDSRQLYLLFAGEKRMKTEQPIRSLSESQRLTSVEKKMVTSFDQFSLPKKL